MRLTHWVPGDWPPMYWSAVESWINLELPKDCTRTFKRSRSGDRKDMPHWNKVVEEFLESGDDWLFSTHQDVQFLPGTLKRLLSWEEPLISGLVFMRQSPATPHIWRSYDPNPQLFAHRMRDTQDWFFDHQKYIQFGPFIMEPKPKDAIAPVDFTSTSCVLVHRSVLAGMEPPWFMMHEDGVGGEDANFFVKAHNAGFQAYVDRSCGIGHIVGDISTSSMDFIMWSQSSEFKDTGEPGTKSNDHSAS